MQSNNKPVSRSPHSPMQHTTTGKRQQTRTCLAIDLIKRFRVHPCSENQKELGWLASPYGNKPLTYTCVYTEAPTLSSRDWTSQPQRALPSNGTHSSLRMNTIESWNMMNYHQSERGRLRGRWEPWYYDFNNFLLDGFISEYATRGLRRAWRSPTVILGDVLDFTKGPSRGTRPSLLNRKKERTLLNKLILLGAEDTSTAKCLPTK